MYLIPFILRNIDLYFKSKIIFIFLNKGIKFIEEDDIESFLEDNEIFIKNKIFKNDYCFLEVDSEKTVVSNFYTYNENNNVECWRRFIMIENDELHINNTNPEFIQGVLKEILDLKI